ncbi:MAG: response regulator transcription factor [Betaproteobacteria bacterium]|nr:response regulator transcription factor [Betaproteobacteria bacterium]
MTSPTHDCTPEILLIEDDPMIGNSLLRALNDEGIGVEWQRDGQGGEQALRTCQYGMILLDLGLPRRSGMELLQQLRGSGNTTPLLIITARDEVDDRVRGLEAGADDYVVKPFGMMELMARIRAVLRRTARNDVQVIGNGEISLNLQTREVSYRGKTLLLPAREFALLHILIDNPGTIHSREQLETRLYEWNREVTRNAVDVLIYYLRKKFDNDIIRNIRGVGWMVLKHPTPPH